MNEKVLTPEAKAARAAYKREWTKKNPDKNREYIARYWEKKVAEAHSHKETDEAQS